MKYMLYGIMIIALSIIIGVLITSLINTRKKLKRPVRIILTVVFAAVLFLGAAFAYLSNYYHTDDDALKFLNSSSSVEVTETGNGYLFDGPGEENALIFYPGAKVEETAYAPLLFYTAEKGTDCFLVKMPFRVAFLGSSSADKIMAEYDYKNWFISGHSLGGAAASSYTAGENNKIKGLVLLASYPLSQQNEDSALLSIYGSEDGCLDMKTYEKRRSLWPANSKEYIIKGGNHAGFGLYGVQNGDGEASITQKEQQIETADIIVQWINDI